MFYGFLYPLFSLSFYSSTFKFILYCTCILLVLCLYCSCIVLVLWHYTLFQVLLLYSLFFPQYYSTSPCIVLVSYLYCTCIVCYFPMFISVRVSPPVLHPHLVLHLYCTCILLVLWHPTHHLPSTTYHLPFKTHLVLFLYCTCIVLVLLVLPRFISVSPTSTAQPHLVLCLYRTCIVNLNPSSPLSHPITRPRTHPR